MRIPIHNYKNIIFDLGGVILNIDYDLTAKAFAGLGLDRFNQLFSKAQQEQLFDLYEKGMISSLDFRDALNNALSKPVSAATLDAAWNAMLLDLPPARLALLKKIKSTHRTFLLSNTNEIHMHWFSDSLQQHYGIPDLSSYFEKVYLSYEINLRKPDPAIFHHVLNTNDLNPSETLFIDDSPQHVESSGKLGIQTHWLDVRKEDIVDLLVTSED
ncbi:MAG TPA: HAD family phosphatase [Chitinophagales bacterium]|nr:HAD family phosphatase [Chitinophagales bacterium]